ncbi:hypothetical protein BGX26_005087 [Mortierella sp. AD094]|nr:hypothetical protein BGX26_005087 [Mortierella sp. AD094]
MTSSAQFSSLMPLPTAVPRVDKIERHIRYEGEDFRIADKTGKIWMEEIADADDSSQSSRPEVDHGVLR